MNRALAKRAREQQRTTASTVTPIPPAPFDESAVGATSSDSLFTTANLTKAIAVARAHVPATARLEAVEVFPGQIVLRVLDHGDETVSVVEANDAWEGDDDPTPAVPPASSFPFTRVSAAAISTLLGRLHAAAGLGPSGIEHVAITIDPGSRRAYDAVYTTGGDTWYQADRVTGPIVRHGPEGSTTIR